MNPKPETVSVELGERSYLIEIGCGLLDRLGERIRDVHPDAKRVLLVSDDNVAPHYAELARNSLQSSGFQVSDCILPAGEATKSVSCLTRMWTAAIEARLDRKSLFVALGGGVIGDSTGFAAASYLRGVPFVQVPTSLLAMVDSSVGGKTGINLPQGKNLIGAFHQPSLVIADVGVLETLPERELSSGLAEVVKYGVIHDADLFAELEAGAESILRLDSGHMTALIRRSCEIKAEVVGRDERESGLRAILNFGHTLGHAIENVSGYGAFLHGEAIAIGMVFAAEISERVHGFPAESTARLIQLLKKCGLPVQWNAMEWDPLYAAMTADKKAENARPRFVLARRLGEVGLPEEISESELRKVFGA